MAYEEIIETVKVTRRNIPTNHVKITREQIELLFPESAEAWTCRRTAVFISELKEWVDLNPHEYSSAIDLRYGHKDIFIFFLEIRYAEAVLPYGLDPKYFSDNHIYLAKVKLREAFREIQSSSDPERGLVLIYSHNEIYEWELNT